jgi:hypothetical protein
VARVRIEAEQLLDERHGHAAGGRHVQPLELQVHVGTVVACLEQAVLLLEVEQRARRYRNDQLVLQGDGHRC